MWRQETHYPVKCQGGSKARQRNKELCSPGPMALALDSPEHHTLDNMPTSTVGTRSHHRTVSSLASSLEEAPYSASH